MTLSDGRDSAEARAAYEAERKRHTAAYFKASPDIDQKALTGATARHGGAFADGKE